MGNISPETEATEKSVVKSEASWAEPVSKLTIADVPAGAISLNLDGHQVVGPLQGFGPMWQRTYRVRLSGVQVSPEEVVRDWKENFARFQPSENQFYPSLAGIQPGEVIFINTRLIYFPGVRGLVPMKSGVMVLYSDPEMFTVMTPEGFPISGWNTFSAFIEDGCTVAQVQGLVRTTDPIYEFGFRFMGGEGAEDKVWFHVLEQLAKHWGVQGQVQFHKVLIDPCIQWSNAKNIWKNAAIRTFFYVLASPFRWGARLFKNRI
ncbi:MAG: hypothetical protein HPY59_12525 [Anaerolineae bacterium]|nr:hypothetical protein [Anaerolineae bacterium]